MANEFNNEQHKYLGKLEVAASYINFYKILTYTALVAVFVFAMICPFVTLIPMFVAIGVAFGAYGAYEAARSINNTKLGHVDPKPFTLFYNKLGSNDNDALSPEERQRAT